MNRDLMQQALKLLVSYREYTGDHRIANKCGEVIAAIETELAKPEHPLDKKADNARELGLDYEPVKCTCGYAIGHPLVSKCICSPPKREWVGLTDREISSFENAGVWGENNIRTIEAKLKELNKDNYLIITYVCSTM